MFYVEIVEIETNEVIERMGPTTERQAERVRDGANINLNHADYFVRIVKEEK